MSDQHRMFNEKEAAEIVVKAARLQEQAADTRYSPGMSYEELKRMAADVGVDEEYLRKALVDTPESHESRGLTFFGAPLSVEFERVVDGELDPENFDVVSEVFYRSAWQGHKRRHLAIPSQVGRTLQGQVQAGTAFGQLRVTARNGRTRIWARNTMFVPFMTTLYPSLLISFFITLATFVADNPANPWVTMPLLAAVLGTGLSLFRYLLLSGSNKMRSMVDEAAEAVAEQTQIDRDTLAKSSPGVGTTEEKELENRQDSF